MGYSDEFIELPSGILAFGKGITTSMIDSWVEIWSEHVDNFYFILILAGSLTAEVEGISAAGATAASRRYTAVADAELLLRGPLIARRWPLPPLDAGVSPALISYVASNYLDVKPVIISSGLAQQPTFPCVSIESPLEGPAKCLSTGKAMSLERVNILFKKGLNMGKDIHSPLLLAECVPGGTTTAFAVLEGLGLSVDGLISGSSRVPPFELKRKLISQGLEIAGQDVNRSPEKLLAAVGDPFQPIAVGLLIGARQAGQSVLLGGGSQMVAILALALAAIEPSLREGFTSGVSIGTTSWLVEESLPPQNDRNSFVKLLNAVADYYQVKILGLASGLRFSTSKQQSLRDYENGYIKEGVGAGALTLLAQLKGVSNQDMIRSCDKAVEQLNSFNSE